MTSTIENEGPLGPTEWTSVTTITSGVLESAAAEFLGIAEAAGTAGVHSLPDHVLRWWTDSALTAPGVGDTAIDAPLDVLATASTNAGRTALSVDLNSPATSASLVVAASGAAIAEWISATAADLLRAYALGRIVGAKIEGAVGSSEEKIGWWGGAASTRIAATVCVAHLLHLDAEQIQSAIGLASTQASGLTLRSGSDLESWRLGCAARDGILAAYLGATPWIGPSRPLDGLRGLYRLYGLDAPANLVTHGRPGLEWLASTIDAIDFNMSVTTAASLFGPSATIADLTPHFVRVRAAGDLSIPVHANDEERRATRVV